MADTVRLGLSWSRRWHLVVGESRHRWVDGAPEQANSLCGKALSVYVSPVKRSMYVPDLIVDAEQNPGTPKCLFCWRLAEERGYTIPGLPNSV